MHVDLSHSELFLRKDGVVQMNAKEHYFTLKDIKEIIDVQGKITNGKRLALLVVVSEFANLDSEAREIMATKESTQYSIVEAYVIHSLSQKLLANFYMKVNKPNVPTKFFTNIDSAEEWLKSYRPSDL